MSSFIQSWQQQSEFVYLARQERSKKFFLQATKCAFNNTKFWKNFKGGSLRSTVKMLSGHKKLSGDSKVFLSETCLGLSNSLFILKTETGSLKCEKASSVSCSTDAASHSLLPWNHPDLQGMVRIELNRTSLSQQMFPLFRKHSSEIHPQIEPPYTEGHPRLMLVSNCKGRHYSIFSGSELYFGLLPE